MAITARQESIYIEAGDDEDEGSPPAKRPRVGAACDQCRNRQVRLHLNFRVCANIMSEQQESEMRCEQARYENLQENLLQSLMT